MAKDDVNAMRLDMGQASADDALLPHFFFFFALSG